MTVLIFIFFVVFIGLLTLRQLIGGAMLRGELFACPNCGHRFYAKWYQLMFRSQRYTVHMFNQARIKCPKCKIRDMCGRPYNM